MLRQKNINYIKSSLAQGKSKEEIYQKLLSLGQSVDNIQSSFNSIANEKEKDDLSKKTIQIIVTIGAVLIGAGIFSFIASNWQKMIKTIKVVIIFTSMLFSYAGGWHLKEKMNMSKTGNALILLGIIIYGAGIFLLAQIFHIRANWPDGFILWMIGVIAVAYSLNSFPLFYLAIGLGIIAIIGHPFGIFTSFASNPFLLTSSFLLLTAAVITFIIGKIIREKIPAELKKFY